jgi:very-short-patch-repair endonuclease
MPHYRTSPTVFLHACELRHAPTEAEVRLWRRLRMQQVEGARFRRQHAIGPYVVDFCAPRQKLVVEVDGGQHLEHEGYDAERTKYLEAKGYRVIRFWNNEVSQQMDAILRVILEALAKEE